MTSDSRSFDLQFLQALSGDLDWADAELRPADHVDPGDARSVAIESGQLKVRIVPPSDDDNVYSGALLQTSIAGREREVREMDCGTGEEEYRLHRVALWAATPDPGLLTVAVDHEFYETWRDLGFCREEVFFVIRAADGEILVEAGGNGREA